MEPTITIGQWFQAAADDDCVVLQTNLNDFQCSLDETGETALMVAVRVGNLAAAHILAEAESKIAMPSGHTALMLAAGSNNTELCRLLAPLESGVTTDAGINALMVAADTGSADALRVLLDYIGNNTDYEEHTALFYAASGGHIECANILVRMFPPTKKELVSCIDMATTQGDTQMLDFLNGVLQEIVGADSINDVIREYRNAAVLERSSSRGLESTSIDRVSYDNVRNNEVHGSANASSDENHQGGTDSMCPYSIYASPQPDTTWDIDSKNDLVISDTSIDTRSMHVTEVHENSQQPAASIFNSYSPTRRDINRKGDEIASLRSQLQTATYEIQRLQNLLKEHSSYSWENKPSNPDEPAVIPTAPNVDMRRLQDKCASLELKVSTLELRNKQLRSSLDDLDQSQSSKVFNDTQATGDITVTEELTVEQILDFLHSNKESAEQVYTDLKQSISTPDQSSMGRPLSIVPIDVDAQSNNVDDVGDNHPDGSRSSSIEMVEMRSPTPGCSVVPGLEERLETENMSLQAEVDALTRKLATKDEQIKTLRQELYDLRQAQLKMSMTMGPSMDSVRPPNSSNKYDLSETNHEIEVDMTISNTSFSCPESHCGTRGDSAGSNQVGSEGREYMMSFDTNNEEKGGKEALIAKLPPLPGTRSNEFEEINASVVQIKLNKIQLELKEALDDKRVILEQLQEERNEKSQLASELNVCRDTIDHMTSEIEDLRDKLDESLAKESTLSNDIMELRGRMNSSPRPGECGSPVSVLGFNDNNQQPSPKMDDIYDVIRSSNSYQELLTKLNFSPSEISDILARQSVCNKNNQSKDNMNKNLTHEISTINLKTGATSNLSPDEDTDQELARLQDSNNALEKKCADLQSSNVVLSAEARKLVSEVISLRDMLKEQEKRYSDLLLEKNILENRSACTNKANPDSLYEQPEQQEQKDIEVYSNMQNRGPPAPSSTQSTLPTSLRGESDSHGYTSGGNYDNRATSYSGSMTDERCRRISNKHGSNTKLERSDPSKRRNPFEIRDNTLMDDEESYLTALQDERDRRMTTQDLEPFSSIMSGTTSTSMMFSFNLVDGVYANVTPLMQAVLDNDVDGVDNNLMYVRKIRSDGATALMLAAYLDRVQIVEKLGPLESNIRGPENLTALEIALYKENYATATILRPIEGIDTSDGIRVTTRRHTDLMTAVTENNPLTVWCLIPLQGRVQDWSGKTALMYAIEQKKTFCARILATAETRLQDRNGFTALMYAVMLGNNSMVNLLVEEEAGFVGRWHERLPSKFTALILACYYGRLKAATILAPFEGGIKDSVGRSPKYYAQHCNPRVPAQVKASLMDLFNGHRGQ